MNEQITLILPVYSFVPSTLTLTNRRTRIMLNTSSHPSSLENPSLHYVVYFAFHQRNVFSCKPCTICCEYWTYLPTTCYSLYCRLLSIYPNRSRTPPQSLKYLVYSKYVHLYLISVNCFHLITYFMGDVPFAKTMKCVW